MLICSSIRKVWIRNLYTIRWFFCGELIIDYAYIYDLLGILPLKLQTFALDLIVDGLPNLPKNSIALT